MRHENVADFRVSKISIENLIRHNRHKTTTLDHQTNHTPHYSTMEVETVSSLEDDIEEVAFLFDLHMEHGSSSDESMDDCNLSARVFLGINHHADLFDESEQRRPRNLLPRGQTTKWSWVDG
jgi:hypothetical protein